jgi:hypothetical protein
LRQVDGLPRLKLWPRLIWLSGGFLAVMAVIKMTITLFYLFDEVPPAVVSAMWSIGDKTNLGPLRLLNFFALAHVTVTLLKRDNPLFRSPFAEPVIVCGQHSLNIFCLGIFLSVLAHFVLSEFGSDVLAQVAVSAAGVLIMFGAAYFLSWSKQRRRPTGERAPITPPRTVAQGGE